MDIPTEILEENGVKSGVTQLEKKGKAYFSALGKKSAEKRAKDKRFGKKYYQALAQKSAEAKRARRDGKKYEHQSFFVSPLTTINKFITGKF